MTRSVGRRALLLAVLPLLVAGSEGGQAALDRFTSAHYRGAELLESSHTNLLFGLAALGVVLLGAGLVGHVALGCRNRRLSPWIFGFLPPVLFVVQEHVEYWVGHGGLSGSPAWESAFLLGLAFQVPFAVCAYFAARLFLRLANAIAYRLRSVRLAVESFAPLPPRDRCIRPRRVGAAGARVTRGPPALIVALL